MSEPERLYRGKAGIIQAFRHKGEQAVTLSSKDGKIHVEPGEWVITDTGGQRYTCPDEKFRAEYEVVNHFMPAHRRIVPNTDR